MRYFIVEEVSQEKFEKIQGELQTKVEIKKSDKGVVSAWEYAEKLDGYKAVPIIIDDFMVDSVPELPLEQFDRDLDEE
jgi:hypothetical protein